MRFQLTWQKSILIWLIYNAIIYATWAAVGADYNDMVRRVVVFERVVLPEILGMIFMVLMLTLSGTWRPVMREDRPGRPRWLLLLLTLPIAFFVFVFLVFTEWEQIEGSHLFLLLIGAAIVGFNEEALTRGIAVIGMRSVFSREILVWFLSTLMFGLMHIPNGFFGPGLDAGLSQGVMTFFVGTGFYLFRRLGVHLAIPMMVHALWDFSVFANSASGASAPVVIALVQIGIALLSVVLVAVVLFMDRVKRQP